MAYVRCSYCDAEVDRAAWSMCPVCGKDLPPARNLDIQTRTDLARLPSDPPGRVRCTVCEAMANPAVSNTCPWCGTALPIPAQTEIADVLEVVEAPPPRRCTSCDARVGPRTTGPCPVCGQPLPPASPYDIQAGASAGRPATPSLPASPGEPDYDAFARERDFSAARREAREAEAQARKKASGALFTVAILQALCGAAMLFVLPILVTGMVIPKPMLVLAVLETFVIVAVFTGLGWWAQYQPLPPAIIGLILYVLRLLATLAVSPELATRGIIVHIFIIIALVLGIRAGAKAASLKARAKYDSHHW